MENRSSFKAVSNSGSTSAPLANPASASRESSSGSHGSAPKPTASNRGDSSKASASTSSSISASSSSPKKGGSRHSIIVSTRQRGNPLLKMLKNVAWEYGTIVPDYEMGRCNCALYLSIRYHNLHPEYILNRADALAKSYDLRVLLVSVDTDDPGATISDLTLMCIRTQLTLILAFSLEEAARYLEAYKAYENKPPDALMERGAAENDPDEQATEFLTAVKGVTRRDARTLLGSFGSVAAVMEASVEELCLCPGFGRHKATRLYSTVRETFVKDDVK